MRGQADGIAHLAWSPNDTHLLSCGREDSPEAIVFNTQVYIVIHCRSIIHVCMYMCLDW